MNPETAEQRAKRLESLKTLILAGEAPSIIEASAIDHTNCMGDLVALGWAEKRYSVDRNTGETVGWYWKYTGPRPITNAEGNVVFPGGFVLGTS